jgi:NAD(P)-dependent dehydrogenase (short-subunit alcohol dehydrogenase family)
MGSLAGQTVLITGATDGLGRHLAGEVAARGAAVLLHGRNPRRAERTRASVVERTGNQDVEVVLADLADLRQVVELARQVGSRPLDVLVNNAGVGGGPPGQSRQVSANGIELRFAVNYLAGYHLTRLLLPALRPGARVVNVASVGQCALDFADPLLTSGYDGTRAYCQSKLAQVMFTIDLAAELAGAGVEVNALHPATYMNTSMVREAGVISFSTVEQGGAATLRLIEGVGVTGRYFNGTTEGRADPQAYDAEARAELRRLSGRLITTALGKSA